MRAERGQLFQRLQSVGRGFHRVTPQRDHARQRGALRFFVVHYQDSRHGTFSFHLTIIVTARGIAMLEFCAMELRPSLKFVKLSYVFWLILAAALAVYLQVVPDHPDWAKWGFVVPAIFLFFTVIRHIQRRMVKLTVLGDRLRYEAGLFSKTTRTIELVKVQDVRVDQTMGQRMVNIGRPVA